MKKFLVLLSVLGCLWVVQGCATSGKQARRATPSQPMTLTELLQDPQLREVSQALVNSER